MGGRQKATEKKVYGNAISRSEKKEVGRIINLVAQTFRKFKIALQIDDDIIEKAKILYQ